MADLIKVDPKFSNFIVCKMPIIFHILQLLALMPLDLATLELCKSPKVERVASFSWTFLIRLAEIETQNFFLWEPMQLLIMDGRSNTI